MYKPYVCYSSHKIIQGPGFATADDDGVMGEEDLLESPHTLNPLGIQELVKVFHSVRFVEFAPRFPWLRLALPGTNKKTVRVLTGT